jgi:hypothetical protein
MVEGRDEPVENTQLSDMRRTLSRISMSPAQECVRKVAGRTRVPEINWVPNTDMMPSPMNGCSAFWRFFFLHPCPYQRFCAKHPREEPCAGIPLAGICAGGCPKEQSLPRKHRKQSKPSTVGVRVSYYLDI